jgi:hypothetical protein
MKKFFLILSLVFSITAFAETETVIYPNVYNYGSSVQVSAWNYSDRTVFCSGTIYMDMANGERDSEYYFESIPAHFTSYRTFYSRRPGDRISRVSHSIFCN